MEKWDNSAFPAIHQLHTPYCSSSGSFAMFRGDGRASSRVSEFATPK